MDRTGQVWLDETADELLLIVKSEPIDMKGYDGSRIVNHYFTCLDSEDSETNYISEYSNSLWESGHPPGLKRIV
jgi:hypothetical protein